jgi:hypothetical protein
MTTGSRNGKVRVEPRPPPSPEQDCAGAADCGVPRQRQQGAPEYPKAVEVLTLATDIGE